MFHPSRIYAHVGHKKKKKEKKKKSAISGDWMWSLSDMVLDRREGFIVQCALPMTE